MHIVTDQRVLSQVSKEATSGVDLTIALMEMSIHLPKGVGISAVQLGHPIRVIMLNTDNVKATIINPVLKIVGKATRTSREGCLSAPGKVVNKIRHYQVVLTGFDEHWRPYKRKLKGFDAFVAQHEVDHLNGITI